MSLADLTDTAPIKRMTVVRGTLITDGEQFDMGSVEAATALAVKRAHELIPSLHASQPTHVEVHMQASEGVQVTVTVQAISRSSLEGAALTGLSVALLCLREQAGAGKLSNLHVVQSLP